MPKFVAPVNDIGNVSVLNASGTTVARSQTTGTVRGTFTAPTVSAELLVNNSFTSDLSGWTVTGSDWFWNAGGAKHTTGTTTALSQATTIASNAVCNIVWTISGRTTGSVTIALGATTFPANTASGQVTLRAPSANATLTVTPTTDFNGQIDDISFKQVTASSVPQFAGDSTIGTAQTELRATSGNLALGLNALRSLQGSSNFVTAIGYGAFSEMGLSPSDQAVAVGANAGQNSEGVTRCTFVGYAAGQNVKQQGDVTAIGWHAAPGIGYSSTAVGSYALETGQSGAIWNTAVGYYAARSLTTGTGNVAMGYAAGNGVTTGWDNTFIGKQADTTVGGVSRALALGAGTSASASGAVAIGTDSTGTGASTTVANEIKLGTANHTLNVPGQVASHTMVDGANLTLGATTGTKFATAATQKQAWWNAAPVAQNTGWSVTAGYTATKTFNPTTVDHAGLSAVVGTLVDTLKTYGLLGP